MHIYYVLWLQLCFGSHSHVGLLVFACNSWVTVLYSVPICSCAILFCFTSDVYTFVYRLGH